VVRAFELPIDRPSDREREVSMGAAVEQRRRLAVSVAEEDERRSVKRSTDGRGA
jgi:hypothetical protein